MDFDTNTNVLNFTLNVKKTTTKISSSLTAGNQWVALTDSVTRHRDTREKALSVLKGEGMRAASTTRRKT